jgi:microcystin-dependent protein
MSDQFLGELRAFGFQFAPKGWAWCNGQTLGIAQNTALFSLLGTTYGGNGVQTFQLPNLQSRVPMHFGQSPVGSNYIEGEVGGFENVTLAISTMPQHIHTLQAVGASGGGHFPNTTLFAAGSSGNQAYYGTGATIGLVSNTIQPAGQNQQHTNIQPYLTINWCIALVGSFPSRN